MLNAMKRSSLTRLILSKEQRDAGHRARRPCSRLADWRLRLQATPHRATDLYRVKRCRTGLPRVRSTSARQGEAGSSRHRRTEIAGIERAEAKARELLIAVPAQRAAASHHSETAADP